MSAELLADQLVHDLRISPALGAAHDLADEEAEQALLPAAVRLDLARMCREHLVDDRPELRGVRDGGLGEVAVGGEVGVARVRDRLQERSARDALAAVDQLAELVR